MRLSASFIAALHDEISRAVHVEREARRNHRRSLTLLDQRRTGQLVSGLQIAALVHGELGHTAERGLVDLAPRARRRRSMLLHRFARSGVSDGAETVTDQVTNSTSWSGIVTP